jgi:hypothetical protein
MTSGWDGSEELHDLCEAAIEGRLTPDRRNRLEQLVLEDAAARRLYVEYLHQHACLRWSVAEPGFLASLPCVPEDVPVEHRRSRSVWRRRVSFAMGFAAAAVLLLGIGLALRTPADFAVLVEGKACKWDGGTLPTEVGARLGKGRLRLAEGLVRIAFDRGAEIKLEGPADLELISVQRCVLRAGRLVAKVPPRAIGFAVETPTAVLNDLGTEFGVNVHDAKASDVEVFNGRVDVQHLASGKIKEMRTGNYLRFGTGMKDVTVFDPQAEFPVPPAQAASPDVPSRRVVHISTASGRGKDAYIQPLYPSEHHSDILLLVKNNPGKGVNIENYNRKAYLGMDLSPIAGMEVVEARLTLTFAPTGMGYASEVPDSTFVVYGLTDEPLDDWDEETIRWKDAPANLPGGANLDLSMVARLGTFEVVQGELSGTRSIEGDALVDFLNRDTNGMATLILVRETPGSGRSCLVHGFANKNHPDLPPPTLRLTVAPRGR